MKIKLLRTSAGHPLPRLNLGTIKKCSFIPINGSSMTYATGHSNIVENVNLLKGITDQIYFTHIGVKTPPHEELKNYLQKIEGSNFSVAYDQMEVKI